MGEGGGPLCLPADPAKPDSEPYPLPLVAGRMLREWIRGISYQRLRRRVEGLIFKKKGDNEAGLQLADLVASPIGRRYLGKPAKEDWEIVAGKLRHGLVVFPKS